MLRGSQDGRPNVTGTKYNGAESSEDLQVRSPTPLKLAPWSSLYSKCLTLRVPAPLLGRPWIPIGASPEHF